MPKTTPQPRRSGWHKSSHSGDNGACVEVRVAAAEVGVRDSKDAAGPVLRFPAASWAAFAAAPPGDPAPR
ncbi:DUF397 domain-containing protein [Plantactinospora siamensis]|uniref:DUF397 domain-containing protein n=1 Tax=Plantactinospora siamensis TaxID=555372 RepID=A0ABV6NT39_9ACTN